MADRQWRVLRSSRRRSIWRRFGGDFRQRWEAVTAARASIVELNRSTLARVSEALPADLAGELRRSYDRVAFRNLFDDPRSAEPLLGSALELPDLTAEQREALAESALGYRADYDAVSERMVAVMREASEAGEDRGRNWQRRLERRNKLEKLRFDRGELNERTRRRLRAILNEHQIERIGGLPEPAPEESEI